MKKSGKLKNRDTEQARIIYIGRRYVDNKLCYLYKELSSDFELADEHLAYARKLFKKGTVGAIYDVEFKDGRDSVVFSKNQTPNYFIPKAQSANEFIDTSMHFKEYKEWKILDDVAYNSYRASKPPAIKDKYDIEHLRQAYRKTPHSQRTLFIAQIVKEITKIG